MAAIRAGILNQGLGNFHGAGYYRNVNYQNRFEDEKVESGSSASGDSFESSNDSRIGKSQSQNFAANALALEKHRALLEKKDKFIINTEKKLKFLDASIIFTGMLGVVFAHAESELYYRNDHKPTENSFQYRAIVSISTAILLVLILIQSYFDYVILKESRDSAQEEVADFFSNKAFGLLLIELCICCVHCPPGIDIVFVSQQLGGTLTISANEICASFILARVYLLFKVFRYFSKWTTHHSKAACARYGTVASPSFAVKSILKEKPFHLLVPLILLSILVFSASIRMFERSFVKGDSGQDYSYIWNAMWMIMLTMTTVGYGDFFPSTHQGRFIAVLACIWGIFLISLMVVTLTNFLLFSNEEARSYHYINRVKALEDSKKFAKLFIKAQLERYLYYRRLKSDPNFGVYVENLNLVIKYNFKKFKEANQRAKFADIEAGEMLNVINERISVQISVIRKNLNYALKVHENLTMALASQNNTKYCLESSINHIQELKKLAY